MNKCKRCNIEFILDKDKKEFNKVAAGKYEYMEDCCVDCNFIHYYPEVYEKLIGDTDLSELKPKDNKIKQFVRWLYIKLGEDVCMTVHGLVIHFLMAFILGCITAILI